MKLLIIGGVAGGASAAARARRLSEGAEIVLFERGPDVSFANCGLRYYLVRADELCVTDLATSLGMKPQAVSNQLQRLSDLGILASRRDGTNIHYRLVDLCA